jgi:hypothetical protein
MLQSDWLHLEHGYSTSPTTPHIHWVLELIIASIAHPFVWCRSSTRNPDWKVYCNINSNSNSNNNNNNNNNKQSISKRNKVFT